RNRLEAQNVLQKPRPGKQSRLATAGYHDLDADRKVFARKAGRNRHRRTADERDRIGNGEPFDIVAEAMTVTFGDIALFDRIGRNDGRRTEQQIVVVKKSPHPVEHRSALSLGARDLFSGELEAL